MIGYYRGLCMALDVVLEYSFMSIYVGLHRAATTCLLSLAMVLGREEK